MNFQSNNLRRRIIFRRVIQGLIVLGIFVMAVVPINHENDIFWQLRMGEEIVRNHHFPVKDPYSLPAFGEVWTLHEWIPSVAFYIIHSYFGAGGLIIFKALVVTLTFWVFMLLFNRLKANLYLSLSVFVLAALVNTRGVWVVFPSIFEYLFLVVTLFLMEDYRQRPRKIILTVLILLSFVWANSHGSFFLLPIITGVYLLGDLVSVFIKKKWSGYKPLGPSFAKKERLGLLLVAVASLIAPLFTPNGYITYLYPLKISLGKFSTYVNEYQRFWTIWRWDWSDFVHGFALILMVILVLVLMLNIKRLHPTDFALGVGFAMLAVSAVRHVAVFGLVALFLIVRYLGVWFGEYRGLFKRSLVKDLLVILMTLSFVFYYKTKIGPFGLYLTESGYPKEAAELIVNNKVAGNMFNHYNYGGYLIWKMRDYKVFIDGRLEMYLGQVGQDYRTILLAKPGWEELLDKYKINFVILYLTDPIVEFLTGDLGWKFAFHDGKYVVMVRDAPQNEVFLSKHWSEEKQRAFEESYKAALARYRADQYNKQGVEAASKNDLLLSLAAFEEAVKYDPKSVLAHLNLAEVLISFDMYEEAKKEYEYVLEKIDSEDTEAKQGLEKIKKLLERKNEVKVY